MLIKDSGGSVASSPYIELVMGHGEPIIARARAKGLSPSLGADVASCGPGDMFSQMRVAFAQGRSAAWRETRDAPVAALTVREVLRAATLGGAEACSLAAVTGSLAPGKQADLQIVRLDQVNTLPSADPVNTLVCSADVSNVDYVLVRGVLRKDAGRLVGLDLARLREITAGSLHRVTSTANA